ncbi:sugar ABC transporter ATP-binding protein [Paramicrobacterium agarici]|uniref:sugar ABC transporter ATP-binding protein n=1 Tax=Paramicrobacterium agarici TaxID=630514 RepID=UPI0011500EDC|nr:sugar ABC transporter ATP-binding protein [Microbacterium agarici]TQO21863.1 monosaccharide ABC transporter ATP-binding protein (CUT2 family) [Microbacterium agarici]
MTAHSDEVILRAQNISKTYGATRALKGVNFEIHRGKVTTLFGENGAGKSTLMRILSGVEKPTGGTLELYGEPVEFASTTEATDRGISIIHQELSLAPNLNVRDNIFMGRELRTPAGTVDYAAEEKIVAELMSRLEEDISPRASVSELRLGQQQIVEIARSLSQDARILIMDEPTSALSASEVDVLFKVINDLRADGVSIVYISHHLEEALQVSDYCVVFRDGELVATEPVSNVDLPWIVRQMVGAEFDLGTPPDEAGFGDVALDVNGVSVVDAGNPERLAVDGVNLQVRKGEIVCIYGLMGAGRTELLEALAGRGDIVEGNFTVDGDNLAGLSVGDRIASGLALVPEDRQRDGMIQALSVGRNLSLASLPAISKASWLDDKKEHKRNLKSIADVHIKTAGPRAPITSLSGGNQQKVVIGKILQTGPKVILLDEPSRGIDIGAKTEVFHLLAEMAKDGLAVLYSTSEVTECLGVANRVLVMSKGSVVAEFHSSEATKEDIMAASGEAVEETNGTLS